MAALTRARVFCGLLLIAYCIIYVQAVQDNHNATAINANESRTYNESSSYVLKKNRRSVLVINGDGILRSKKDKVESLRYEEYDENGKKLNTFMMYNMQDVYNFFKLYLNTEICYVKCDEET